MQADMGGLFDGEFGLRSASKLHLGENRSNDPIKSNAG